MKYSWIGDSSEVIHGVSNSISNVRFLGKNHEKPMEAKLQQGSPTKKFKRFRSAFTTDQVNYLEREFRKFPYIGNGQRKEVAIALNIPERAVKIWFQNRRMKEKKDANNKDVVNEQTKTPEYDKDQLFNVGTLQSTNEQPSYSLPLLTTADSVNKSNDDNSTEHKRYRVVIKRPVKANYHEEKCHNKPQDIAPSTTSMNSGTHNNIPEHGPSPLDCKSSEELSINLCKRYKKECDNGVEFDNINKNQQGTPVHKRNDYQDSPEDLSYKKRNVSQEAPKPVLRNAQCFPLVSNCYQQSFMPPGGVVWKPINVMPIVPTRPTPVALSTDNSANLPIAQEQNVEKKNCNCDCHVKTYPIPIVFQPNYQSPQYIITAVPFQNSSPKL